MDSIQPAYVIPKMSEHQLKTLERLKAKYNDKNVAKLRATQSDTSKMMSLEEYLTGLNK